MGGPWRKPSWLWSGSFQGCANNSASRRARYGGLSTCSSTEQRSGCCRVRRRRCAMATKCRSSRRWRAGPPSPSMDLSVQPRARRVARPLPVLRIVEMTRLRLHEEPDLVRVERLVTAFRRDGVLRNPPVVVPSSSGARPEAGAVVLDGANRVTALREAGATHAAVQVVSYTDPEVSLSTWRHYVGEKDGEALRDRAARHPGLPLAPLRRADEAAAALARREAAAAIVDRRGAALVGPGTDPLAGTGRLAALVSLSPPTHHVLRIVRGRPETLSDEYGPGTLRIVPELGQEELPALS